MDAHLAGDDAEALHLVRTMLRQADAIELYSPFATVHSMAMSMGTRATDTLRQIVPSLSLRGRDDTRREARALIRELLDERATAAGQVSAVNGHRTMQLDIYESLVLQNPRYNVVTYRLFMRPALAMDTALRNTAARRRTADVGAGIFSLRSG